ncbi:6-phosphogluconolactonase/glucosamine-6-phosphate isomerase/deaminase [Enterococcus sp. PF1-24]|uniref:glucosamine-6-phosphate deaminase n=1 Tax=unclassified Enterococcus TaxID=2608891 RepID=UPI002474631B|nr:MULTISPECIES: glucosamine-6-phosphate deaminase [unclassified Enterococcus]MDH6364582.1 6-phosphogluconolactonase/glucosamine-6-phosphate isomerase/deaminase [Enterococcus sp. PFB1-1]MDH6401683.1 6-phosphogluconolactonase/glucosamine-6-phosphate isomerase/deaminase [Enterococcus sp. PF1-24]
MKIIKVGSSEEFNQVGASLLLAEMFKNDLRVNLAITAGNSPKGVYQELINKVKEKDYLKHVHYYNFDEIPYKVTQREGITISDLRELYFNPAKIAAEQIHKMDMTNFKEQDAKIAAAGGLDAILMGIGADGHFCGNLPGTTKFGDWTTEVICDEPMKNLLSRMYEDKADTPDSYITMGPRSVMAAKHLIMIANGESKAEIIKKFVEGPVTEEVPSTILTMHPNLTLLVDAEAGKYI